jgi:hypothetical protein
MKTLKIKIKRVIFGCTRYKFKYTALIKYYYHQINLVHQNFKHTCTYMLLLITLDNELIQLFLR